MPIIEWNPPRLTDHEIEAQLGDNSGLVGVDRNRMSRLLCEQLAFGIASRTLNSFEVTDVLQALEGHSTRGHVEIRPFNRHPLKGLMHAHFLQATFLPKNIANEIKTARGKAQLESVLEDDSLSDDDKAKLIAYKATVEMFESRSSRNALTGEWIIYAEHQGHRYYLALASHTEKNDMVIYNRMMERCEKHFQDIILSVTR